MKRLGRLVGLVGMALLLLLVVAGPIFAIANPTDTSVKAVKVFQNIFEDDDLLFFVRYDVNYASVEGLPSASDTFLVALYDTDGTTLLYQRALNYYGFNIISIYLTPVQADSLTWGSECVIKVVGNPSIFGELEEGVNMATKTLSPLHDYYAGGMEASREGFGIYCIATARLLQDDADWPTLVTDAGKLNTRGAIAFNEAVPGLYTACPTIYSTVVLPPTLPTVTRTVTLVGAITGDFTSDEIATGGTSGATGTFITGSQEDDQIQVTHSGVTMFRVAETVTGGTSGATVVVSEVLLGKIQEAAAGRTGTRLRNALDNFGAWLGISGNAFGGIALFLLFAITAGFVFTSTGNVHGAVLVSIPVILMGNFMGLLPFAITWILVVVVALLFSILFIMGRLA